MLARAVTELLDRRNLTVNGAHMLTGISREVITKLTRGHRPGLWALEEFARAFSLDVNEWRQLAGYPPIKDPRPPMERLLATVTEVKEKVARGELSWQMELDQLEVLASTGRYDREDLQVIRELMEEEFAAEARKQGRETTPALTPGEL